MMFYPRFAIINEERQNSSDDNKTRSFDKLKNPIKPFGKTEKETEKQRSPNKLTPPSAPNAAGSLDAPNPTALIKALAL